MTEYKATPRSEQETVLNYDNELGGWSVSTDVPKHIKKYLPLMDKKRSEAFKDALGNIVYLKGILSEDALVSVRKRPQMSAAQKQASAERLAAARNK